MAVRVTATEVKEILDNCTLSDDIIDVYINTANILINDVFGTDTLSASLMKEIERWYAAHLVASTRWRTTKKEKLGDASVEYTGKFNEDLSSTPYGQVVKQLDTSGKMADIGKKAVDTFAVESFSDTDTD